MRSVSVVLPASICAAMPMLRVRSSGYLRFGEFGFDGAADFCSSVAGITGKWLPAEMGKGTIRLRHFMSVVALLDRVTLTRSGVFEFGGKCFGHRHAAPVIGVLHDPAHRERNLTGRRYFH